MIKEMIRTSNNNFIPVHYRNCKYTSDDKCILEVEPFNECIIGVAINNKILSDMKDFINILIDNTYNEFNDDTYLCELFIDNKIKNFLIDREARFISIISNTGNQCICEHYNGFCFIRFLDKALNTIIYCQIPEKIKNKIIVLHSIKQLVNLV